MASVILDFYDEDAPNTLLGSIDDSVLTSYESRPALFDLGALVFRVRKIDAAANANLLRKTNLVRIRYPVPFGTTRKWVGVLKDYRTVLVSHKEGGGEFVEWTAVGGLYMLSYAALRTQPFAPGQPELGSLTEIPNREWVWINEPAGAILKRVIEEGQNEPGAPLSGWSVDFDRTIDSAGNLWTTVLGEFRVPIGTSVLTVVERLATAGDLFLVLDPDLTLHAYQSYADFTVDRTGAFGVGNVRFEHGVNIVTELSRETNAIPATHITQRASDGDLHTEVDTGYGGGRGHYIYNEAETNDGDMLERIAQRAIDASQADAEQIAFEVIPGDDEAAGEYFPGDHYDLGDLATVSTGSDDVDLEDAALRIVGWRVVLDKASKSTTAVQAYRSLHVVPQLAYRPLRNFSTSRSGFGTPGATPGCSCLRLCQQGYVAGFADRLYFTDATAGSLATTPDAAWDNIAASGAASDKQLTDDSSLSLNDVTDSNAGGSGVVLNSLLGTFFWELGAELAAKIAAGGLTVKCYLLVRTRHGAGVSDSAQDMVSQEGLRVTQGATATIRGTALPLHSLGSSGGSTKWPSAIATARKFPPAAASDVTIAVPGTVAGDRIIVEVGYRNFTVPIASGGAIRFVNGEASDLPEDESTTTLLNGWIEFSDSSIIGGCAVMDTVRQGLSSLGECSCAAHGDHVHEHGLLDETNYHGLADINGYVILGIGAPTATDDEDDGYVLGAHWIDTTSSSSDPDVYILTDTTAGAAVWAQIAPAGTGGGSTLTVEEEDGSPSVSPVTTIQVPNGRLTNDGGGVVSLDMAGVGHSHGAGSGGGALVIPTLLQSVKAAADTPDDEFPGTSLDGKWTVVDGSAGTVAMLAAAGTGVYQVGARDGWLAMQVGPAAGDSVELRQDYTLPDGKCLVAYLTFVADNSVASIANNEIWTGIGVNDNDAGPFAGATGQTAHALFDTDASGYRIIGLAGVAPTYVGSNFNNAEAFQVDHFFRIDRSGLNYDLFHSSDGFGWSYIGRKTMATAANNIWLWAWCNAAMSQRMVVWCPWIRQGTALAFDPWPL